MFVFYSVSSGCDPHQAEPASTEQIATTLARLSCITKWSTDMETGTLMSPMRFCLLFLVDELFSLIT